MGIVIISNLTHERVQFCPKMLIAVGGYLFSVGIIENAPSG